MKVRCGQCRQFIPREGAIRRGLSYFCDSDCLYQKVYQAQRKVDVDSARSQDLEAIRREVNRKDGFRCRYCGKKSNLIVHHVMYRSEITNRPWQEEISNKISLCNEPCHLSIIHANKKKYQPLCLKVVWLREIYGDTHTLIKDLEDQ